VQWQRRVVQWQRRVVQWQRRVVQWQRRVVQWQRRVVRRRGRGAVGGGGGERADVGRGVRAGVLWPKGEAWAYRRERSAERGAAVDSVVTPGCRE